MSGGRKIETTPARSRVVVAEFNSPTVRTSILTWAVKSLLGRAKLGTSSPPDAKSAAPSGTAELSPKS